MTVSHTFGDFMHIISSYCGSTIDVLWILDARFQDGTHLLKWKLLTWRISQKVLQFPIHDCRWSCPVISYADVWRSIRKIILLPFLPRIGKRWRVAKIRKKDLHTVLVAPSKYNWATFRSARGIVKSPSQSKTCRLVYHDYLFRLHDGRCVLWASINTCQMMRRNTTQQVCNALKTSGDHLYVWLSVCALFSFLWLLPLPLKSNLTICMSWAFFHRKLNKTGFHSLCIDKELQNGHWFIWNITAT